MKREKRMRKKKIPLKKDEQLKVIPLKSQLETTRFQFPFSSFRISRRLSRIISTKLNCNYTRAKARQEFRQTESTVSLFLFPLYLVVSRRNIPGKGGRMMRGKKKHMFRIRSFLPVDLSQGNV